MTKHGFEVLPHRLVGGSESTLEMCIARVFGNGPPEVILSFGELARPVGNNPQDVLGAAVPGIQFQHLTKKGNGLIRLPGFVVP